MTTIGLAIPDKENERRRALLPVDLGRMTHAASIVVEEGCMQPTEQGPTIGHHAAVTCAGRLRRAYDRLGHDYGPGRHLCVGRQTHLVRGPYRMSIDRTAVWWTGSSVGA